MNKRDQDILVSLQQFRVLDRDQIIALHFEGVKDAVSSCNKVLKRLQRDKYITCDNTRRPYLYFPVPSSVRKDSGKLFHFKAIADFVIEAKRLGKLKDYEIEIKLGGKGTVEPDVFMIWNNSPFFVEVQRSNKYSKKYMETKFKRYEEYFHSNEWTQLHWQNPQKPVFPLIWVVSDTEYKIETFLRGVYQSKDVQGFKDKYMKPKN